MVESITFQGHPVVRLTDAHNEILLSPTRGARLLRWRKEGREVILWPENADWANITKVRGGDPVLFPFLARHFVKGEKDKWMDAAGVVRPMPQHGFCRDTPFTLVPDDDRTVRMRLVDNEMTRGYYPFAFQFDVVVRLLPESCVEILFETTNLGTEPLPYYAGHHFYFSLPHTARSQWRLHCPVASWGTQSPDGSIVHTEPTTELLHLDDPAIIDRFQVQPVGNKISLYNVETNQKLLMELKPASQSVYAPWFAVTTWTQATDSDFYCIEPWLGLPNAIHHKEGLRWVGPGLLETAGCVLDGRGW